MLKLRSIGLNDYRVLDAGQRIGRIRRRAHAGRLAVSVTVPLPGDPILSGHRHGGLFVMAGAAVGEVAVTEDAGVIV